MKCPYCECDIPLTWTRYVTSRFGKHTCPECGKPSRLEIGVLPILLVTVAMGTVAALFAFLLSRWLGGYWDLLALVPAILIGLPLDKMLDERCRGLKPLRPYGGKVA